MKPFLWTAISEEIGRMNKLYACKERYKVITSLDDIPGDALYFMDETAVESGQGVPRLVGGKEYHKWRSGHMSAGDKQAFHVTLCLTTSADGKNNIPAYVIHSSSSKEADPEKIVVDLSKFNEYLISEEEVAKGIDGTVTKSGSMLKGKFLFYLHFYL